MDAVAKLSRDERMALAKVRGRLEGLANALRSTAFGGKIEMAIVNTLDECGETLSELDKDGDSENGTREDKAL